MAARAFRVAWTILSLFIVECVVFGLALLPGVVLFLWLLQGTTALGLRIVSISLALFPAYLIFALTFMVFAATAVRLIGWRTPPDAEMTIRDLDWRLLGWVRYVASTHLVRLVAGAVFRGTPVWTFYLRLNGATAGQRVYVNSLSVMDHNLLEFGEGTVVGADVHLSGHTVEGGVVHTGRVRIGRDVTLGTGSVIGIGVEIGDNTQVGALSLVPKYAKLAAHGVYFGIPVHRVEQRLEARD